MGRLRRAATALLLLAAAAGRAHGACDTTVTRTDGSTAPLAAPGKPAVVFYEDRASTHVNDALKQALYERGRRDGLLDAVRIVAVANIQAYDFFPARDIAVTFIRGAERAAGVPILIDLRGVLSSPPWTLPRVGASVLVLDAGCREVWRKSGALDAADRDAVFARLAALLGRPAPGS